MPDKKSYRKKLKKSPDIGAWFWHTYTHMDKYNTHAHTYTQIPESKFKATGQFVNLEPYMYK